MPAYDSSYTGQQIDNAIGAINSILSSGGFVSAQGIQTILEDYLTISDASSTYLTQSDASSTYAPKTGTLSNSGIATSWTDTWSDGTNSHPWYGLDMRYHNTGIYSTTLSNYFGLTLHTSAGYLVMNASGNVGIGTTSPSQKLHVSGGVVAITANSNTVTFGSQNSGFCHIYNSASIPFIFNYTLACAATCNDTSAAIGTWAYPFHRIILGGTTNATMSADSTNPRITFCENTGTQPVHLIYSDWDNYRSPAGLKIVGGASATPAWLEVEGAVYGKSWNATSSREIKHAITNLDDMGTILDGLNPVSFIYNDDPFNQERYGLIYEDTVNICPVICSENGQFKTINYIDLIPVLIKEIQSLRRRIKLLENN